jgi:hypothetical protein
MTLDMIRASNRICGGNGVETCGKGVHTDLGKTILGGPEQRRLAVFYCIARITISLKGCRIPASFDALNFSISKLYLHTYSYLQLPPKFCQGISSSLSSPPKPKLNLPPLSSPVWPTVASHFLFLPSAFFSNSAKACSRSSV